MAQGQRPGEILSSLKQLYEHDRINNEAMLITDRALRTDMTAIKAATMADVQLATPQEVAGVTMESAKAEMAELWSVVRACGVDKKHMHTKVTALGAMRMLRNDTREALGRLGVIPEKGVVDDMVAWIMSLGVSELARIEKAGPDAMLEIMEDRMQGRDPQLMKGEIVIEDDDKEPDDGNAGE